MTDAKKRILMTLIRFDIGGAETHVLELSLELKRMGYHVVIASNGGVYEKNLAEAGITHYKLPMHSKTPKNIKESLKGLKKIIKNEKIDIVHAHGRIPAFLCGILQKYVKFTFVTTAHWVFDVSHGLKYITNWGEKVVAVSEDIKQYLIDNYKTNPSDIFVTINGIDTEKFKKDADFSSVIDEFSLSQSSKKIVYISRMDEDRAKVAFELAQITPELVKINLDLEIVIVGGGNVFDKLQEQADKINNDLGKRHIILTGARTDIYKFAALGDIFIGVSRSALEAMACEKPVIVAGNEGYIGIFDEDKLDVSIKTNFCCRELPQSSCEKLFEDTKTLLENNEEENARLGQYGRSIIKSNYSLSKMANDCVKMYNAATDFKKYDAVISGYYGYGNAGDESLLYAMIENLRAKKDDVKLLVLSKTPEKTAGAYGIYAQNRYNFIKMRKAIKESKMLIFGGGSLIQDVTSSKSLWYYLFVIKQALLYNVPVMFYANGIGPVQKQKNRAKVAKILKQVDVISLRDENSLSEIEKMGISNEKVFLTADPALTIVGADDVSVNRIFESEGIPKDKKLMGIAIREWKNCCLNYWDELAHAIESICKEHNISPLFIPLKHDDDVSVSEKVINKMNIESYMLKKTYSSSELVGIVGKCELVSAMRLHAAIYAASCAVPVINLSYDPKVSGFAEYIGIDTTMDLENFSKEEMVKMANSIFENKDRVTENLSKKVNELKILAEKNADLAFEFFK